MAGRSTTLLARVAVGLALGSSAAPARAQSTCEPEVVLDCRDGLRTLVRSGTYPLTEDDGPLPRIAENEAEWGDLWRFYGLPGRPPAMDHAGFVIFALVASADCPPVPPDPCAMLFAGPTPLQPQIPRLEVWIFAFPRATFRKRCPHDSFLSGPTDELSPKLEELEQIQYDPSCYAPEFARPRHPHDPFWEAVRFQSSLQGVAGIDTAARPVYGALLGVGFARRTSDSAPWYDLGNEAGLELRARLLRVESGFFDSRSIGLRPWLAHARRWSFDLFNLKRKPSLLGVLIPEGGALHRTGLGLRPYLAWSAPFLWHHREFFYRKNPYLLREHFAVYFEAGVLWVPGEPVLATLSLGVGLH